MQSHRNGGAQKTKILDYYTLMDTGNPDLSYGAIQRIPIRGACKICFKPIRGSHRVKSNFICHLKRCHPEAFDEFEILSGRKSAMLSISSLDDPVGAVAAIPIGGISSSTSSSGVFSMNIPPAAHFPPLRTAASDVHLGGASVTSFIGPSTLTPTYSAPLHSTPYAATSVKKEMTMVPSSGQPVFPMDVGVSTPNTNSNANNNLTSNSSSSAKVFRQESRPVNPQQQLLNAALIEFIIGK